MGHGQPDEVVQKHRLTPEQGRITESGVLGRRVQLEVPLQAPGRTVLRVIDHHLMRPGEVPPALALVNPNRPDDNSGQGMLAAAGVAFVLLAALNRQFARAGSHVDNNAVAINDKHHIGCGS